MLPFKPNKRDTEIALYAGGVCAVIILFVTAIRSFPALLGFFGTVFSALSPVFYGFVFAYLLRPLARLFENLWKKKIRSDVGYRVLALVCTYVTVGAILFVFVRFLIPLLIGDGRELWNNTLALLENGRVRLQSFLSKYNITITADDIENAVDRYFGAVMGFAASIGGRVALVAYKLILGVILCIPMLYYRAYISATFRRFCAAVCSDKICLFLHRFFRYTDGVFGKYLLGKIVEITLCGLLYLAVLLPLRFPYAVLLSVLMGLANIVPAVGGYIGGIPAVIILCTKDTHMVIWFVLIALVIQQIDATVIGPKVIGSALGMKGVWVIASVAFFGGLFGAIGIVLAAPLFSILYMLVRDFANHRLQKKGLPTERDEYAETFTSRAPERQTTVWRRIRNNRKIAQEKKRAAREKKNDDGQDTEN